MQTQHGTAGRINLSEGLYWAHGHWFGALGLERYCLLHIYHQHSQALHTKVVAFLMANPAYVVWCPNSFQILGFKKLFFSSKLNKQAPTCIFILHVLWFKLKLCSVVTWLLVFYQFSYPCHALLMLQQTDVGSWEKQALDTHQKSWYLSRFCIPTSCTISVKCGAGINVWLIRRG